MPEPTEDILIQTTTPTMFRRVLRVSKGQARQHDTEGLTDLGTNRALLSLGPELSPLFKAFALHSVEWG